jgi:nitrogen fixation NifU-like protein
MDTFDDTIERIIEISEDARLRGTLTSCTDTCEGGNPSCGDHVAFTLQLEDGIIADVRFDARGCTISKAAAVIVAEALLKQPVSHIEHMTEAFIKEALGEVVQIRQGCLNLPLRVVKEWVSKER